MRFSEPFTWVSSADLKSRLQNLNTSPVILMFDNADTGGEIISDEFSQFCSVEYISCY